jgi:hypothetical protein
MSSWSMPVLGLRRPHHLNALLGTGYDEFESPAGIVGLAKEEDDTLHLLALHSGNPGHGQLRELIAQAKRQYRRICVWEIWNEWLPGVLERYGFEPSRIQTQDGELLTGMVWEREKE